MKKLLLSILTIALCFSQVNAQSPQKINYQGVARSISGAALASQSIGVKISIRDVSAGGIVIYSETHAVVTNAFGLYNLAIGTGTVVSGTMIGVNWATNDKFISVEMDPAGGTAYIAMGTSQLLAVPYSLRAEDAGKITIYSGGTTNGNKMVIQHSPAYPTWGLQYSDTLDQFRFLGAGIKVMEIDLGANKVNINGALKITSGTPGVDKILTSDAAGNATWQLPVVSSFTGTANYVAKFTGATSAGNSQIFDNGTFVGIGTVVGLGSAGLRFNQTVTGANYGGMNISTSSATGLPFLSFGNVSSLLGWMYFDGNDAGKFKLYNGGERLTVTNDGKIGIATTTPSTTLDVNGTATISGANTNELNRTQTGSANLVPIAYGSVAAAGTISTGTGNFTCTWNATSKWYEITIATENYFYSDYITMVTPITGGSRVQTGSVSNMLLVTVYDNANTAVQGAFQFVTFKP
jgi:hypothetical protein